MIFNEETGEILNDKFAKLYFDDIEKLFGLSGTDINVLLLMSKVIGMSSNQTVNMTPKRKKEFAKKLGLKTHQQVTNSLNKLVGSGVIKKKEPNERFDYNYILNPDIIFSGNDYQRVKVMIEYTNGERKVRAFSNEEQLMKYLSTKENK